MSYGYDTRGQVLTALRSHRLSDQSLSTLDDAVWGGEPMVFNDIGARGSSPLNRLESLSNAAVPLWGMAPASQPVLIDGTAASRDRAVFWRLYNPDPSSGNPPQWRSVSLSAASGAWQQSGYLYVPPLEGNLRL